MTTAAVGDFEHPKALKWAHLPCPPGEYVAGLAERQGGWTAKVGVLCAAPSPSGGWASAPVAGGTAGGEYGSHNATLMCPRDHWVAGLGGMTVYVDHMDGLIQRIFLADPVVSCGAPGFPGFTTVSDPAFKREKGGGLDVTPARYRESQVEYCPAGTFARSAEAAVEPEHHPDIKAVRLNCASLGGASGSGSGAGGAPVATRPGAASAPGSQGVSNPRTVSAPTSSMAPPPGMVAAVPLVSFLSKGGKKRWMLTTDPREIADLSRQTNAWERVSERPVYAFNQPIEGGTPLHRYTNVVTLNHDFVVAGERDGNVDGSTGYIDEGICCYVTQQQLPGTTQLYKFVSSDHGMLITASEATMREAQTKMGFERVIDFYARVWTTRAFAAPAP